MRAEWTLGRGLPDPHLDLGWVDHEYALEDLGEVPQVEGVVGLGWGGQQLGGDGGVHHDGRFHEGIRETGNVGGPSCGNRSGLGSHRRALPVQPLQILAPCPCWCHILLQIPLLQVASLDFTYSSATLGHHLLHQAFLMPPPQGEESPALRFLLLA